MSKVKVLIEHEGGHKQELNGDTVICFTVSKAGEFLDGKAQILEAKSKEVKSGLTEQEKKEAFNQVMEELLKAAVFGK